MSRAVLREEIAEARSKAQRASSRDQMMKYSLLAENKSCKLAVRDCLACMTAPVDGLIGSRRIRELPVRGADETVSKFMDRVFSESQIQMKNHYGDVGVLGNVSFWLMRGTYNLVGGGTLGVITSAALVSLPMIIISQVASLPNTGLKALGNGVGNTYALFVANRRASSAVKSLPNRSKT